MLQASPIADQIRICRLRAEQEAWQIVEEHTDRAISGASLLRPDIPALMGDAARGGGDLICAETMDRLSRDQEDIAGFFQRMAFAGVKTVTPSEGEVIRRIFRDYAAGKSPKRIATELNAEGISAPTGGDWDFSTINCNVKRGTGILNNELYIGRLVWNRQRFVKNPDTGKRQARPNPPEEWVIQEVPELRIVDEGLWQAVKARQAGLKRSHGAGAENSFRDRRRPKYLLSGLTRCGVCGGGYSMISATHVGCSTARTRRSGGSTGNSTRWST
ncbi:MAG: recombinase family protein [Rhodobacteraceae bacterium]|nr:recombinase family protein [Paracoccaceae bacterium]